MTPCYLSRHNGRYAPPREALRAIPGIKLNDVEQSKNRTFCCGGPGGGSVWKEETQGSRINYTRVDQLMQAEPETIAVGCPYCMIMMDDAVKGKDLDEQVQVKDLVELVSESLNDEAVRTEEAETTH